MSVTARGALALLLVWGLLAAPGAAAELDASAWWWRAQTGVLQPLPAPPTVPDDGIMVGGAPDGPTAVAAVRFHLDEDEAMPELTLEVAHERGGEVAELVACPTREGWTQTRAGRWDTRPEFDCEAGAVEGVRAEDGETWTFSLGALVADQRLNVVIVQAPVEQGPRSVFEISFEAPSSESLNSAEPIAAMPSGVEGSAAGPPPDPVAAPPADGGGFTPPADSGFESTFDPDAVDPGTDFGDDGVAEPPEVAEGDVEEPLVAGAEDHGAADDAAAAAGEIPMSDAGPDVRTLAMMVALLCVAGLVMLSEDGGRRLLAAGTFGRLGAEHASSAGQHVRGLGRFARPREGRAPTLF